MAGLPEKNQNIDRTSKYTSPEFKPGPFEAVVINNLDPEFHGAITVQLRKMNESQGIAFADGELYTAKYLQPFGGSTPGFGSTKNTGYKDSQQSYGMWMVPPDVGTTVLVIFAEGNPNMCYWLGVVQDKFMNFSVPGHAATTLLNEDVPDNLKGKKLPASEYNKVLNPGTQQDPTRYLKPYQKRVFFPLLIMQSYCCKIFT